MEHIRQYDWCASEPERSFLLENEIDNCVTEKILKNKYCDPLLSESDSETDEIQPLKIDWNEICKKKNQDPETTQPSYRRGYVACLKSVIHYPRKSNLTIEQQNQLLKVISFENQQVLQSEYVLRPTKGDRKMFESLKEIYEEEQKEYIEWAKVLWTHSHCVRALRPKQTIEMIYEAEYKMKTHELNSFAKHFQLAAQIPFEAKDRSCVFTHQKDLIHVNMSELPQIEYPDLSSKYSIMKPRSVPEPCAKHPCRFILPNEKSVTTLTLMEIYRELAQFASDNGCQYIVSEKALRCFVEIDRIWNFPISVIEINGSDGEKSNIVVMGSDFSLKREVSQIRAYKAYRHLLEFSLIPPLEKAKQFTKLGDPPLIEHAQEVLELSSDEEEDSLFIDAAELDVKVEQYSNNFEMMDISGHVEDSGPPEKENETNGANTAPALDPLDIYNCSCKDSLFESPPPRSFKKWKLSNKLTKESFNVIVHCSHKAKTKCGEVIMEPIPEYQLDLGASRILPHRAKGLALSLALRKHASLITVRVDASSGEVVRYDTASLEDWKATHGEPMDEIWATIHAAFSQLQGLIPGSYILQHEPSHGSNAMLFVSRPNAKGLLLEFNNEQPLQEDEARGVKTPPTLEPVLLPYHKFRRILPCAFSPYQDHVAKEVKKPPVRQKPPPNAIKWPKKKKKGKKKKRNNTAAL